jgi:uncharacterized protein (TIGR02996 family)
MSKPRPVEEILLLDIVRNPEDITPRLVLADRLSERGDPRGEYIALACEPDGDERHASRLKELLNTQGKGGHTLSWHWMPTIFRSLGHLKASAVWRRGFIEEFSVNSHQYWTPKGAKHLFGQTPITAVRLPYARPEERGGLYGWTHRYHSSQTYYVPLHISDLLDGYVGKDVPSTANHWVTSTWYASQADAMEALSRAYVAYGRSLAFPEVKSC